MTTRHAHLFFGIAAIAFYLGFFAMGQTVTGMEVRFVPPWNRMVAGELNFWMAATYFLLPAGILAGLALERWTVPACSRLTDVLDRMDVRKWALTVASCGLLSLLLFWLLHEVVLLGTTITDDENSARFGGQVLAMGKTWAAMSPMHEHFPHHFILAKDGAWSSTDFTGVQLAWAISELTRTEGWVFHFAAMLPVPALMYMIARLYGRSWGVLALGVLVFSPMVLTLSYTTHAHVLSRGFLAVAITCFYLPWRGQTRTTRGFGALALALALVCRPFEVAALVAPLVLLVSIPAAIREGGARSSLWSILAGVVLSLVIMAAHNWALSGNPFVSARFMENDFPHPYGFHFDPPWEVSRYWERFGANLGYNTMMLGIWFLGPIGVVLAAIGSTANRRAASLGLGVLLALGLALLHDDHGLHIVGPIHYSEAAIPLVILTIEGLKRSRDWLVERGSDWRRPLAVLLVVLPVTFGTFSYWHGRFLHDQSLIHVALYDAVNEAERRPAVLLVPQYASVWGQVPAFRKRGSWVFEWRPPRPSLDEDVLIVHDGPGALKAVQAELPERHVYRMKVGTKPRLIRVEPVE